LAEAEVVVVFFLVVVAVGLLFSLAVAAVRQLASLLAEALEPASVGLLGLVAPQQVSSPEVGAAAQPLAVALSPLAVEAALPLALPLALQVAPVLLVALAVLSLAAL
jgi:hypothetical protein